LTNRFILVISNMYCTYYFGVPYNLSNLLHLNWCNNLKVACKILEENSTWEFTKSTKVNTICYTISIDDHLTC